MLAEKRVLTSQDTVVDHVSSAKAVTTSAPVSFKSIPKQQQQPQETNKTLKKQSVTTINSDPLSLNHQHNYKAITKQPPTKPRPLLGMERRAHMMAERRQARMERQRQREERLLVS